MKFKPTLWKTIVSIILSIIISFILNLYYWRSIFQNMHFQLRADGIYPTFNEFIAYNNYSNFINSLIIFIFITFIIIYVIWSLVQKNNKTKKR